MYGCQVHCYKSAAQPAPKQSLGASQDSSVMRGQGFHTICFFTLLELCPWIEASLICLHNDYSLFNTNLGNIFVTCTACCGSKGHRERMCFRACMPSGSAAQPLSAPPPHHPPLQSRSRRCAWGRSWCACLALRLAARALTHTRARLRSLCARGHTAADASATPALSARIILMQEALQKQWPLLIDRLLVCMTCLASGDPQCYARRQGVQSHCKGIAMLQVSQVIP